MPGGSRSKEATGAGCSGVSSLELGGGHSKGGRARTTRHAADRARGAGRRRPHWTWRSAAVALLVELLVIGPLIAATSLPPVRTSLVAGLALVLSIPLGLSGDGFGSAEHITGVAVVAIGGALAVAIAATARFGRALRRAARGAVRRRARDRRGRARSARRRPLCWRRSASRSTGSSATLGARRRGRDALRRRLACGRRARRGVRRGDPRPGAWRRASACPGQVWESGETTWLERCARGSEVHPRPRPPPGRGCAAHSCSRSRAASGPSA